MKICCQTIATREDWRKIFLKERLEEIENENVTDGKMCGEMEK